MEKVQHAAYDLALGPESLDSGRECRCVLTFAGQAQASKAS